MFEMYHITSGLSKFSISDHLRPSNSITSYLVPHRAIKFWTHWSRERAGRSRYTFRPPVANTRMILAALSGFYGREFSSSSEISASLQKKTPNLLQLLLQLSRPPSRSGLVKVELTIAICSTFFPLRLTLGLMTRPVLHALFRW